MGTPPLYHHPPPARSCAVFAWGAKMLIYVTASLILPLGELAVSSECTNRENNTEWKTSMHARKWRRHIQHAMLRTATHKTCLLARMLA